MTTKTLLLIAAAAALMAGVWLMLSQAPSPATVKSVTVLNYDPPGLPYALIATRAGPSPEHARVMFIEPGEVVEVVGRDAAGGWLLLSEERGWISLSAGEITGDIDALPIVETLVEPRPVPVVSVLNPEGGAPIEQRMGPSESFPAIDSLEPGAAAVAIARDPTGRWLMTDPGGWVPVGGLDITGDVDGLPVLHIDT